MKTSLLRFLILLMACLALTPAMAADKVPAVKFETQRQDVGTIYEKKGKVSVEYQFTNTGDAPLVIISCSASCGCTKPEYPQEPIAPGKSGVIKVTYNPQNRPGEINSAITVRTNDKKNRKITLRLTGLVVP